MEEGQRSRGVGKRDGGTLWEETVCVSAAGNWDGRGCFVGMRVLLWMAYNRASFFCVHNRPSMSILKPATYQETVVKKTCPTYWMWLVRVGRGGKESKVKTGEKKRKNSLAQKLIGLYIFCVMNKRELCDLK
jgi:hypothetical protein